MTTLEQIELVGGPLDGQVIHCRDRSGSEKYIRLELQGRIMVRHVYRMFGSKLHYSGFSSEDASMFSTSEQT